MEKLRNVGNWKLVTSQKKKKSRRNSSDMLTFLQEKLEFDKERLRQEQE